MAKRDNHYEAAFEAFLRARQVPYVAVDEAKRSCTSEGRLKNLDFIVSPCDGLSWLIDVKGRRFPSGEEQKQFWKNWSTREDLQCMARWERLFGERSRGLFVFAYNIVGNRSPLPASRLFRFRDRLYGFVGIPLDDYTRHARPISARWDTLAMPTGQFRRLAAPVEDFWIANTLAAATG